MVVNRRLLSAEQRNRQYLEDFEMTQAISSVLMLPLLIAISVSACKTPSNRSATKDDTSITPTVTTVFGTPAGVVEPFAKGNTQGMFWEARFNLPPCNHPPHKAGAFCTIDDQIAAAAQSGIESELRAWANDPNIKSLQLAYFSFSDKPVAKILCDAANNLGKKVNLYLHKQNMGTPLALQLQQCSPGNINVISRGTEFGTGYLMHAKVFLASSDINPLPLHMMPEDQRPAAAEQTSYFTSSSANMSSFGTSLHFDNWLFFTAKTNEYLVQQNLCFFYAIGHMQPGDPSAERQSFAQVNHDCVQGIQVPMREDIKFFPVPHGGVNPQIFPVLKAAMDGAQTEIKVAADRMTTSQVYRPLTDAKVRGLNVSVILDDDTLRTGKCNGGSQIDQNGTDVQAMRNMKSKGLALTFMETNGDMGQLQHNKFMVFDNKTLIQGAGNFTSTALNISGPGNFEHYYVITTPEIVQTYSNAWDRLRALSTLEQDHEVASHQDIPLTQGPQGPQLDPSQCH